MWLAHLEAQNIMLWYSICNANATSRLFVYTDDVFQSQISIPGVSQSAPSSYIQSRRWPCSRVWPHKCWPDRRLQLYSHWWGLHSCQHPLVNKKRYLVTWVTSSKLYRLEHSLKAKETEGNIPPLDSITLLSPIFKACDTICCQLRQNMIFFFYKDLCYNLKIIYGEVLARLDKRIPQPTSKTLLIPMVIVFGSTSESGVIFSG